MDTSGARTQIASYNQSIEISREQIKANEASKASLDENTAEHLSSIDLHTRQRNAILEWLAKEETK